MNQQLVDYVQQARAAGMADEEIKANLLAAGWQQSDVLEGLGQGAASMAAPEQNAAAAASGIIHAVEQPEPAIQNPVSQGPSLTEIAAATVKVPWYKKINFKASGIAVAVIVILGVGGYFIYAKAFNTPERVWTNFSFDSILNQKQIANHLTSQISYADKIQDQDFSAQANITTDYDSQKGQSASSSTAGISYKYGGATFSFDNLQLRTIDNAVYINVQNVPFIGDMAKDYDGWIKIDANQYKQLLDAGSSDSMQQFKDAFNKIAGNKNIVSGHKYLGSESVEGTSTYHYALTLDKQLLIQNANDFIDSDAFKTIFDSGNSNTAAGSANLYAAPAIAAPDINQVRQDAKQQIAQFINNMDIQTSDIWIGQSDHMLHKYVFSVKMPSLIDATLGAAQGKASDAKTMADARQLGTALELYYNDHNSYPNNLNQLAPMYIGSVPAPTDSRSNCADKPGYSYTLVNKTTYKLDFCISEAIGSQYPAGIWEETPTGIQNIEPHPEWSNTPALPADKNATLTLQMTFSNRSGSLNVVAPDKYYDFGSQEQSKAGDSQRLADIRQLATGLELFYNDAGGYPPAANGMPADSGSIKINSYMASIPTAPTPPAAGCSATDNAYVYTPGGTGYTGTGGAGTVYPTYTYTFCLGSTTGGLAAGKHIAQPSGIQ